MHTSSYFPKPIHLKMLKNLLKIPNNKKYFNIKCKKITNNIFPSHAYIHPYEEEKKVDKCNKKRAKSVENRKKGSLWYTERVIFKFWGVVYHIPYTTFLIVSTFYYMYTWRWRWWEERKKENSIEKNILKIMYTVWTRAFFPLLTCHK